MTIDKANSIKAITMIAAIAAAVTAIGGAVAYIWAQIRPNVEVLEVNYKDGTAHVMVKGKHKTVYANSTLDCGGGWGIRFGTFTNAQNQLIINRLELVRNNAVAETLAIQ